MGFFNWFRGKKRDEVVPSHPNDVPKMEEGTRITSTLDRESRGVEVLWKKRDLEIEERLKRLENRFDTLQSQWIEILDHQQRIMGQLLISQTYGKPTPYAHVQPSNADMATRLDGQDMEDLKVRINGSDLDRRLNFSNFLTDETNRFAFMASKGTAAGGGTKYNPLLIIGPPGTGKTHLLNGLGNCILEGDEGKKVHLTTMTLITEDLRRGLSNGSISDIRERYMEADALLVDNLQTGHMKGPSQEQFLLIIEGILRKGGIISITSDRELPHLADIGPTLRSRLEGGVKVTLGVPGFEGRRQILADLVKRESTSITTEVLDYLALSLDQNVREMQGSFSRLVAYSDLMRKPISISMIKSVLEGLPDQDGIVKAPEADLIESVDSSNLRRGISSDLTESIDASHPQDLYESLDSSNLRRGISSGEREPEMENDQSYLLEEALEEGKAPDIEAEIAAVERELMMELEKEKIIG